MNKLLREIFVVIICLILGYIFAKYALTSIRGSDYNKVSTESIKNENRTMQ